MLGAIIGDMVGSIYEFNNLKSKDIGLFDPEMRMTDDSLLTIAISKVLMKHYPFDYSLEGVKKLQNDLIKEFVDTWKKHINVGWGSMFYDYCLEASKGNAKPYNSYGNGSAMRISSVSYLAKDIEEVKKLSKIVTEITHNHPEGIKGAEAISVAIFMALHGSTKTEIKEKMIEYYPRLKDIDYQDLLKKYTFNVTCEGSVPEAIYSFLISDSLEDTIRTVVSIGGDTDTIGAMAGAIAEAYYQKDNLSVFETKFLYFLIDKDLENYLTIFYNFVGSKKFRK